jgi:hypothetical protein
MSDEGDQFDDYVEDEEEEELDEDAYFEEMPDVLHLPADDELMGPMQDALYKQLTDEHERVELQLREKEEHLKKQRKEKEDIGVQLYGVQQRLAKMQI